MKEPQFGLFILGPKGLHVLESLVTRFGAKAVGYIVLGEDKKVADESASRVREVARQHEIQMVERAQLDSVDLPQVAYRFAIGWRWLIENTGNLIVFHDSLLPKYRGFAPLVNALVNGESEVGVTALSASENFDEGDIIGQVSLAITYPITIADAIMKISPLYAQLAIQIVDRVISGAAIEARVQEHEQASYSLWLDDEDYRIDWRWSASKIARFIDSVGSPYAGAQTTSKGALLKILSAEVVPDVLVEHRDRHLGKILFFKAGEPIVVCGEGLIRLIDIRNEEGLPWKPNFRTRFV